MKSKLLLFFAIFLSAICNAQTKYAKDIFFTIEKNIENNFSLSEMSQTLQQLRADAWLQQNPSIVALSNHFLIVIKDKKAEDSLHFINSAVLDSVLENATHPDLLALTHIQQARRLIAFSNRFHHRSVRPKFKDKSNTHEYRNLSIDELDSLVVLHFEKALQLAEKTELTELSSFIFMSTNIQDLLFKPSFLDVVYQNYAESRKVKHNYTIDYGFENIPSVFQIADTFKLFSVRDRAYVKVMSRWANSKNKSEQDKEYLDVLTKLTMISYDYNYYYDYFKSIAPETFAKGLLNRSNNLVAAKAMEHLIPFLISKGNKYLISGARRDSINEIYRLGKIDAINIWEQSKNRLDSFGDIKQMLQSAITKTTEPVLNISTSKYHIPNHPEPLSINYRNLHRLKLFVTNPPKKNSRRSPFGRRLTKLTDSTKIIKAIEFELPDIGDFQTHKMEHPFIGLEVGTYSLFYDGINLEDSSKISGVIDLTVTNSTVVNNDKEIFVLNRLTGEPLIGAKARLYDKNSDGYQSKKQAEISTVDKIGVVKNIERSNSIEVLLPNDTVIYSINNNEYKHRENGDAFSKEEYDNKAEYFTENAKLEIFTDRSIYRPGQTVHYKALITIPDLSGTKRTVLNNRFLKIPFYQKLLLKIVKAFDKNAALAMMSISDPFHKEQESIKIRWNSFGSFSGKFMIPKNAAKGRWSFDSDFDHGENEGDFYVEEYKRPTFEISIEKPNAELYLGDSTGIKIKVRSFAGATLNNVKIKYFLTQNFLSGIQLENQIIIDTIGFTNGKGELLISLPKLDRIPYEQFNNLRIYCRAQAIDGSGESQEEDLDFDINSAPIRITTAVPSNIDLNKPQSFLFTTSHSLSGSVAKKLSVKLYRVTTINDLKDQSRSEFDVDFGTKQLISKKRVITDEDVFVSVDEVEAGKQYELPAAKMLAGRYKIVINALSQNNKIIGTKTNDFKVYSSIKKAFDEDFSDRGNFYIDAGSEYSWLFAQKAQTSYAIYHVAYFRKKGRSVSLKEDYMTREESQGLNNFVYQIPEDAYHKCYITRISVQDNKVKKEVITLSIKQAIKERLEFTIHQYRKVIVPGEKQKFSLQITAHNRKASAELLTTIYDATLDKLEGHKWSTPREDNNGPYWNERWVSEIKGSADNYFIDFSESNKDVKSKNVMWWHNPLDYSYDEAKFIQPGHAPNLNAQQQLFGLRSEFVGDLSEIVVSGYSSKSLSSVVVSTGMVRKAEDIIGYLQGKLSGVTITAANGVPGGQSWITIRGSTSITGYNQVLTVVDGVIIEPSQLEKMDANLFKSVMVLKGAEATALYGSRASNGVLILSTNDKIILPEPKPVEVVVRKNFNETAFFAPAIHASANGFYEFEFTMPESVTEWNWKLFAHTKRLLYGYKELKLQTQLPLMVQANMPRFLYQGDRINLKTRISNLDSTAASGKFSYKIEDAVTGEDLSDKFMKTSKGSFDVKAESNDNIGLWLTVPGDQLNPIKVIVKAASQSFGDGEEHIIPILAKRELITLGIDYNLKPGTSEKITTNVRLQDAPYAIGLTIRNQPQAAIINSLPALVDYPYNCAEQMSAKVLALCTAIDIMRKDSSIQKSQLNKGVEETKTLPDDINENTMPWLALNNSKTKLQAQLQQVFDSLKSREKIVSYLEQLQVLQKSSGGFSWFPGGKEDLYISNHLMVNFKFILDSKVLTSQQTETWQKKLESLVGYVDEKAKADKFLSIYSMYSRSLWLEEFPLDSAMQKHFDSSLFKNLKPTSVENLYDNALLIQTAKAFKGSTHVKLANELLDNIYQLGYQDEYYGLRWKSLANSYSFSQNNQETIGQLLQAFKDDKKAAAGITQWLLSAQQDNSWGSTKANTTVITALRGQKINLNEPASVRLKQNDIELNADNNTLTNNSTSTKKLNGKNFGTYEISNSSANSAKGQVMFYYFSDSMPTNNQFGVTLKKSLGRLNKQTNQYEPITEATKISIGDEVSVTLYINASNTLTYVYLDDKRAAGFEPKETSSGYEWTKTFSYYKSLRDASAQFFIDKITAGEHTITYNLVAAHEGSFINNRCALQCMYQPGVKVYSNSQAVELVR